MPAATITWDTSASSASTSAARSGTRSHWAVRRAGRSGSGRSSDPRCPRHRWPPPWSASSRSTLSAVTTRMNPSCRPCAASGWRPSRSAFMRKTLWRRELRADAWRYPGEDGTGEPVLTLAGLLQAAAEGRLARTGVGVSLGPTDNVELLAPLVERLALIVVQFEKSGDGRGFSQAQLLGQRVGYGGELRAGGAVSRDHLFLLARCGFDALDFAPGQELGGARAQVERASVASQCVAHTPGPPRPREGFAA